MSSDPAIQDGLKAYGRFHHNVLREQPEPYRGLLTEFFDAENIT